MVIKWQLEKNAKHKFVLCASYLQVMHCTTTPRRSHQKLLFNLLSLIDYGKDNVLSFFYTK